MVNEWQLSPPRGPAVAHAAPKPSGSDGDTRILCPQKSVHQNAPWLPHKVDAAPGMHSQVALSLFRQVPPTCNRCDAVTLAMK